MKVTNRYNQHRRDLDIDMECENCGAKDTNTSAYDDRNYWDNVVPSFKCKECGKSSNDIGAKPEFMPSFIYRAVIKNLIEFQQHKSND